MPWTPSPPFRPFPVTPLAVRALEYVRACETEPVANHSIRSYLFATLLAEHEGLRPAADFDPDLLFFACVLHDLGTSPLASGTQRFEVDGADMAATFLTGNGIDAGGRGPGVGGDRAAQHARHPRAPRRRSPTSPGSASASTSGSVPSSSPTSRGRRSTTVTPGCTMATALIDEIVRHAARGPLNAPRYTIAGELARDVARTATRRPWNGRR